MNHLNSVVIEGDLADVPREAISEKGTLFCTFQIDSVEHFIVSKEVAAEISRYTIRAYGALAGTCLRLIGDSCGARVIGRLKNDKDLGVIVVANHVEFKAKKNASAANSARED